MRPADNFDWPRTVIPKRAVWAVLGDLFAFIFLGVVATAIFVPLSPSFPAGTQLDDSWVVGMNEAVALGLSIGSDIVFTFGPYASVYTNEYHRATDSLMLFGGSVLALGFATVLWAIGALRGYGWSIAIALAVLVFFKQKDAVLFAYPLLVAVYVHLRYLTDQQELQLAPVRTTLLALLFVPFGLLPLIKGSALMIGGATALLCGTALALAGRRRDALLAIVVPCVACVIFWLLAGQSMGSLFQYFWNLAPIVAGYTPAMSSTGRWVEIALYLSFALLVTVHLMVAPKEQLKKRFLLALAFALFLFLAFKAGFVRHDRHALIAGAAAGIAGLTVCLTLRRRAAFVAIAGFAVWVYLDGAYFKTTTHDLVARATNPFLSLRNGAILRWNGGRTELDKMAAAQRAALARECPLERVDGSVDIYSYRQACLIFSGNKWSPRPVFQSYSAYTPRLAAMNAHHLIGERAPKHILFRVEPIDNRLPSLEDGLSWPLLLSQYQPRKFDGDLVYLTAREDRKASSVMTLSSTGSQSPTDQDIAVPNHSRGLVAQIEVRPTFVGRLASVLFKSTELHIQLTLESGAERRFRFVPGMGAAGFVLSPYVSATRDFVLLQEGNVDALSTSRVRSFKIERGRYGKWFWSDQMLVRFLPLNVEPATTRISKKLFDEPLEAAPMKGKVDATVVCDGSIDRMNGVSPVPMSFVSGPVISLDGWTAVSSMSGELPERVYIAIRDSTGKTKYFPAKSTPRPDVRDHFKQAGLLNSGFDAYIDLSSVAGDTLQLFIAQESKGRLIHCQPFRSVAIAR